jgi:hypothetical protein
MAKGGRSYIDNMVRQFGENWLIAVNPDNIQRSIKRIVKDMVNNGIDYGKYGQYFLDSKFLENLIIACTNEFEEASLHYNALVFYQQYFPQIPNIGQLISHDQSLIFIYSTVVEKLKLVKMTNNIGELYDVGAILYQYRNHLN